ncbi:unnamed protein product [Blepharisma stoltei]|uniref:Uncharacterized protein n=1 Tax=Blepharisma stoltei TaxID=1481888 RepID=A0AAU9KKJ6_9CILI|nr:unnamed protein product [Blepharisma stoltei]
MDYNLIINQIIQMKIPRKAEGNQCIYCLLRSTSLCLLFVGFANIGAGIAVCAEAGNFTWYNGGYIILGVVITILVLISHLIRKSRNCITFYILLLSFSFLGELGFALGIIFYTDYSNVLGEGYADAVRYSMLAACGLILLCLIFALCYRNSLNYSYFKIKEQELLLYGAKIETPKADLKKKEMEDKYEKLREKRDKKGVI